MKRTLHGSILFSNVRVHDDAAGARIAQAHRAHALTLGADIAFAPGRTSTASTS